MGIIALITVVMGYNASKVEMSYELNRTVPPEDPDMVFLNNFKKQFGEDGNIMAVGMLDSSVFQEEKFTAFSQLGTSIRLLEGVNEVISLPRLKIILKDTIKSKFYSVSLFPDTIRSQQQLDSLLIVMYWRRWNMHWDKSEEGFAFGFHMGTSNPTGSIGEMGPKQQTANSMGRCE